MVSLRDLSKRNKKKAPTDTEAVTVTVPTEEGDIEVKPTVNGPIAVDLEKLNSSNNEAAENPAPPSDDEITQAVDEQIKHMGTNEVPEEECLYDSFDDFRNKKIADQQLAVGRGDLKNGEKTKEYEISAVQVIRSYEEARRKERAKNRSVKRVQVGVRMTEASREYMKRRVFDKRTDLTEYLLGALNKRLHDEGVRDIIID